MWFTSTQAVAQLAIFGWVPFNRQLGNVAIMVAALAVLVGTFSGAQRRLACLVAGAAGLVATVLSPFWTLKVAGIVFVVLAVRTYAGLKQPRAPAGPQSSL